MRLLWQNRNCKVCIQFSQQGYEHCVGQPKPEKTQSNLVFTSHCAGWLYWNAVKRQDCNGTFDVEIGDLQYQHSITRAWYVSIINSIFTCIDVPARWGSLVSGVTCEIPDPQCSGHNCEVREFKINLTDRSCCATLHFLCGSSQSSCRSLGSEQ